MTKVDSLIFGLGLVLAFGIITIFPRHPIGSMVVAGIIVFAMALGILIVPQLLLAYGMSRAWVQTPKNPLRVMTANIQFPKKQEDVLELLYHAYNRAEDSRMRITILHPEYPARIEAERWIWWQETEFRLLHWAALKQRQWIIPKDPKLFVKKLSGKYQQHDFLDLL